jgi:hypothetical protein
MTKPIRPKTSRKAQVGSKPSQSRSLDKVRKQAPKSNQKRVEDTQVVGQDQELVIYERAIGLFNAGQFQVAREAFAELLVARNRDMAHSSELRMRMCEKRLGSVEP